MDRSHHCIMNPSRLGFRECCAVLNYLVSRFRSAVKMSKILEIWKFGDFGEFGEFWDFVAELSKFGASQLKRLCIRCEIFPLSEFHLLILL